MNIRIDGKGLRFKITDEELQHLLEGKLLEEILPIGSKALSVAVEPSGTDGDKLEAVYDEDTIRLVIAPEKLHELSAMGRSREGLLQEGEKLAISLQVDYRTQKRQTA